jgi:hypothetical protein
VAVSTWTVEGLVDELLAAVESPRNAERRDRPEPRVYVYMENLGWAQIFGYDMNDFYGSAETQLSLSIRQKLFQLEHFDDDGCVTADLEATIGMYWDYPMVGLSVRHQPDGVPLIQEDHPLRRDPDIRLLAPEDFRSGGEMPRLFGLYSDMLRLADGRLSVRFPTWQRGPLDMAVQLRGYEQFVLDCWERPEFVHDLLRWLVDQRMRWWDAYCEEFSVADRTAGIADDWINAPFITPAIFRDFLMPRYLDLEAFHGKLTYVHSCGDQAPFQRDILAIRSLPTFEQNPWTDLDTTLRQVPPDKSLTVSIKNADVLLLEEADIRRQITGIVRRCAGRSYCLVGQALQRMHGDAMEDVARAQRWIGIVRDCVRECATAP